MRSLKKLFCGASPDVLKDYFDRKGAEFPINFDWSLESGKLANAIEKALADLPHDKEDSLRAELEAIQEIGTEDGWIAIDEVCGGLKINIPDGGGAEDAAFFVALNHTDILRKIVNAASMNRYSGGKQWSCYKLDGATFTNATITDTVARENFVNSVLEERDFPVSRPHLKDWFSAVRRDPITNEKNEITYLTLYLLDRPVKEMTVDENMTFLMALRQRVDEMIFAINPSTQEIEVYAKGGVKRHKPLASAFGECFFGKAVDPVRVEPRDVNFGPLTKKPDFDLSPEDRVDSVSVVKLKFFGNDLRSLYEHASDDNEIYDILKHKLGDRSPLQTGDLIVAATLKIKRAKIHGKTLTIDLGYPARTTLPNQTEEDRILSSRLLERWGILAEEVQILEAAE